MFFPWYYSVMPRKPRDPAPEEMFGEGWCACGPALTALPVQSLETHSPGCLAWDYAMLTGKVTPAERSRLLDAHAHAIDALAGKKDKVRDE